jgi:hypothetical protein
MSLLTITIISLSIILAVGILLLLVIPLAFAEEVITILPGAQDHNRPRFLDITFYPIEKGKELTWFNDDDVSHRIIINSTTEKSNSTELVADSGVIKPEDSYTYIFEEEGTYRFSSPTHPWINGNIIHRTYLTDNLVITIF